MEDPETGDDLGRAGSFSWHDSVPDDLAPSFERVLAEGIYDEKQGGYYYWDAQENLWWTFDTPDAIKRKLPEAVAKRKLGGVFAWGLGEDAPLFEHLDAVNEGIEKLDGDWENDGKSEL